MEDATGLRVVSAKWWAHKASDLLQRAWIYTLQDCHCRKTRVLWVFRATCLLFSHSSLWSCPRSSVAGAPGVPLPPSHPSNLAAPPQHFGSNAMNSSPWRVVTFMLFLHGHLIWIGQNPLLCKISGKRLWVHQGALTEWGLYCILLITLCRCSNSQSYVAGPASLYPQILQNCLGNGQSKLETMILKYFGWWIFLRICWELRISSRAKRTHAHLSKFYVQFYMGHQTP